MTTVTKPKFHHIAITVTDMEVSIPWYETIFGIRHQVDIPHEGGVGKLLSDENRDLMFVLHHHERNNSELFAETATGLDHVGLAVTSRAELEAWQQHLAANGVSTVDIADKPLTQSPIVDAPYASVLVFRDPDNIQLELFAPAG